jgi:hypothetical protein
LGAYGAALNGFFLNGPIRGQPGALLDSPATSVRFTNEDWTVARVGSYMDVFYTNALNPSGSFTVEFWAKPASAPPLVVDPVDIEPVYSTVCSLDTRLNQGFSRIGYVFYIDGRGGWQFRLGGINGYLAVAKGGSFTVGGWTHVAGVSTGSSLELYVDGQQVAVANFNAADFTPNTNAHFRVGMTTFPNRCFNGWIEEVAFYQTNLDANTIKAHFDAASTNTLGYADQILVDNPIGYWRLGEPGDPIGMNLGALGAAGNASYIADAIPGAPGVGPPDYSGFDTNNRAVSFDGLGGYVQLPPLSLNVNTVSITGWVKTEGAQPPGTGIILNRSASGAGGLTIDAAGGLGLGYNWNNDPATYNWDSGLVLPDSDWAYVALVVQPTQAALFMAQGTNVTTFTGATNVLVHAAQSFDGITMLGGDPIFNNRYFAGLIDEVAMFGRALSVGDVFSEYAAAIGGVAPQIFAAPQAPSNELFTAGSFTLSVDAGGTPELTYQWRKDGQVLTDATMSALTRTNIDTPDKGSYDVVVSNSFGSVTSQPVAITITEMKVPAIVQNPRSRTLYPGGTLALTVSVSGGTLDYQWQKDGVPIPDATTSTYVVASAGPADSGSYIMVATNQLGSATSDAAVVTVVSPAAGSLEAAIVADGPEAWWRLDEGSGATLMADAMGRHEGTYTGAVVLGQPGAITESSNSAASFDGTGYGLVPYSPALNAPSMTLECWAKPTELGEVLCPASTHFVNQGCYFQTGVPAVGQWTAGYGVGGADYYAISRTPAATMASNTWSHLVITVDSGTFLRFYINGQWDRTVYFDLEHNGAGPLLIGARGGSSTVPADMLWKGAVDEVVAYSNVLSLTQIRNHYAAGLYGTNTPPVFKLQPEPQVVQAGSAITLRVQVEGTLPITLQWFKDTTPIINETNTTVTLSNVTLTSAGQYQVMAINPAGTNVSSLATVSVMPPPTFANLTNGLVLHLRFDGDEADSSGLGHEVIAHGVPLFIGGPVGSNAIQLTTLQASNVYNYVSVPAAPDLNFGATDSFSISFWINYTNVPGDLPMIGNATNSTFRTGWVLADSSGQLQWTLVGTDDTSILASPVATGPVSGPKINDGNWHNVIVSVDRLIGLANTYIDGAPVNSLSIAGLGSLDTAGPIALGQDPTGTYPVDGSFGIDDVGIWRRALTAYDAGAIYQLGQNFGQSFDSYGPVRLVQLRTESGLQLIWQAGTLIEADSVDGPWSPVPGATPPTYMVTPGPGNKFFAVQL